jgi:murein DD-endopeptidase MepM/ murein hydrolase activator NlpD
LSHSINHDALRYEQYNTVRHGCQTSFLLHQLVKTMKIILKCSLRLKGGIELIKRISVAVVSLLLITICGRPVSGQDEGEQTTYLVETGDTWHTVAWRFGMSEDDLRGANPHPNRQRLPTIGSELLIPLDGRELQSGELVRSNAGGLLQLAASKGKNLWQLAQMNNLEQPYRPLLNRSLFIQLANVVPRDLPPGFTELDLSHIPAFPGQATALRGGLLSEGTVTAEFSGIPLSLFNAGHFLVGIFGTGAFFPVGDHELSIWVDQEPLWSQPWRMTAGSWTFEEITLTGSAAAITQEDIANERERLQSIWSVSSGPPLWDSPFNLPLQQFLQFSSLYGARRSYNGGPYRSYHEGLDFSAYGGTPVFAPARGQVVLAEVLDVRGGAVIIDHGLGLHSGLYHLSEVSAVPGQFVEANEEIGKVGSTGLSTGNHLHWDLLVGTTWIDPASWINSGLSCWILAGEGAGCEEPG